jgi:2-polyprenyl-3-methyl-5-hydroxy-6-metoxy-1,4-benzoquinol methylase
MHKPDSTTLEPVSCPLCAAEDAMPFLYAVESSTSCAPHEWPLQRCRRCDLIFLNPRPTEVASSSYYENTEYLPFSSAAHSKSVLAQIYLRLRTYNLAWKRKLIERLTRRDKSSTKRLLDIGCGTGEFLSAMRNAGWEVAGLERDPEAARYARDRLRLNVISGAVDQLATIAERFDVITLWHVLEHLYHPRETMQHVARLLQDHGIAVIAVPNIGGVDAKIYGKYWVALDAPRHVQHFTWLTLQSMAATAGLRLRLSNQLPLDAFFNALMSEKLHAAHSSSSWLVWPLRLTRMFFATCLSLLAGSQFLFSAGKRGATIVGCFVAGNDNVRLTRPSAGAR